MKKLFLNLNILSLFTIASVGLVACENTRAKNYNSTYDMGKTKDFDLESFMATEFQSLDINAVKNNINIISVGFRYDNIVKPISDFIFEQIIENKAPISDELKTLKQFCSSIILNNSKVELTNKNQQLKINIQSIEWKDVERNFKNRIKSSNLKLVKSHLQLGLNNVKKYYDYIKGNKVEFTIQNSDERFWNDTENAKKILEEDNKNNIDKYHVSVDLNDPDILKSIHSQLLDRISEIFRYKNTKVSWYIDSGNYGHKLRNDLPDKDSKLLAKFDPHQSYQTVIGLTDENRYTVLSMFQLNFKLNMLIHKLKELKN